MSKKIQNKTVPTTGSSKSVAKSAPLVKKKTALSCGSCSGLYRDKLIAGCKTNCFGQGKLPAARPCSSYKADVFTLAPLNEKATMKEDHLQQFASCISGFTLPELTVLAALLLGEKKTRQSGFSFWQKVYIRIRGTGSDNYVNNFVVGRILDANKEYVRVVSEVGKTCIQVVNEKDSITLYTHARFDPLRAEMRRGKKLVDPSTARNLKRAASTRIEPIDFAAEKGLIENEFGHKARKARVSHCQDLVSIVQKMNTGKIASRKDKKSASYSNNDLSEISIHHR